jgi:hypothetical protein
MCSSALLTHYRIREAVRSIPGLRVKQLQVGFVYLFLLLHAIILNRSNLWAKLLSEDPVTSTVGCF